MTDVIIPGSFDELCTENKTFGVSEVNCATSLSSNDYEDDIQGIRLILFHSASPYFFLFTRRLLRIDFF